MDENFDIEYKKLLNNPSTRVPICLCLDVSGSMANNGKIDELNKGLKEFIDALYEDEIARDSAELCIIAVGRDYPELVSNFRNVDDLRDDSSIGNFTADGATPLGHAVQMAIRRLNERKELYKETVTDYYQPWLVIMSDGAPTDDDEVNETIPIVRKMIQDKKLYSLSVIIGEYAEGAELLGKYASSGKACRLQEIKMRSFFKWLSASVSRFSVATPGSEPDIFARVYDSGIFLK
jgi:uncharacterized protein YegL